MGVTHQVEVRPAAARALRKVHPKDQVRLRGVIALLAANPRPPGAIPLKGRDAYRVRVGDYRIIYTIQEGALIVVVVALGHRRDVYR